MRKKLFAALEGDEVVNIEVEGAGCIELDAGGADVEILDAEDEAQVEDDLSEAAASDAEVADGAEEVEQSTEDVVAVESYIAEARRAAAAGGLNEQAAKFMKLGLESITERNGLAAIYRARGRRMLPAMESFSGGLSQSMAATNLAIEAAEEVKKTMWQAIVAKIKSVWEAVVNFFKRHFTAAGTARKALEKIIEVTKESGAEGKSSSVTVKNPGLVKALQVKGKVSADGIAKLDAVVGGFVGKYNEAVGAIAKGTEQVMATYKSKPAETKGAISRMFSNIKSMFAKGSKETVGEKAVYTWFDGLPGNRKIAFEFEPSPESIGKATITVCTDDETYEKTPGSDSVQTLTNAEVQVAAKTALAVLGIADEIRKAADGTRKTIETAVSALVEAAPKEGDAAATAAEAAAVVKKLAPQVAMSLSKSATTPAQYLCTVAGHIRTYCELSLRESKKAGAEVGEKSGKPLQIKG